MRFQRRAAAIGAVAAGALLLSACGSDGGGEGEVAAPAGIECAGKPDLRASGSSAQNNAITQFITAYEQACAGQTVNYTASGSGAGRNEFLGGQTDFAGSDSSLSDDEPQRAEQRCQSPAWNLPLVFGPIAIAYNIPGVQDLILDGPTAGRVFNGGITTWNDPAIAALNPGKQLPAAPIIVNFRSDESGTSENFQTYLNVASQGTYPQEAGDTFNGGVGVGAARSQGVTDATTSTPNSVTYVESGFAQRAGLGMAQIINAGGGAPAPLTPESVGAAIESVQVEGQGNDLALNLESLYSTAAPGAYPIALATYEIVCSNYPDDETGAAVKSFLQTALSPEAQQALPAAGYVPLPDQFRQRLVDAVNAIQ